MQGSVSFVGKQLHANKERDTLSCQGLYASKRQSGTWNRRLFHLLSLSHNITHVHSSMLGPRDANHAELYSLDADLDPLDVRNEYSNNIRAAMFFQ